MEHCQFFHVGVSTKAAATELLRGPSKKDKAKPGSFFLFEPAMPGDGNTVLLAYGSKTGKIMFEPLKRPWPDASFYLKKKDTKCADLTDLIDYIRESNVIKLESGLPSPTWVEPSPPRGSSAFQKSSVRSAIQSPSESSDDEGEEAAGFSGMRMSVLSMDPEDDDEDEIATGFAGMRASIVSADGDFSVPHSASVEPLTAFVSFERSDKSTASTAQKIISTLQSKPKVTVYSSAPDESASDIAGTGQQLARSNCFVAVLSTKFLASRMRTSEMSLAYTLNIPIYCLTTEPYEELGAISYFMRQTLGCVQWLQANPENYEAAVGELIDSVLQAPSIIRNFNADGSDDTYGDYGEYKGAGDPYKRLYNPTSVPDLADVGTDWWILKFGREQSVDIGVFLEAFCSLPLEDVAPAPQKLVDAVARIFAPESMIFKSQVAVALGLIDPDSDPDYITAFTGTELLQYVLNRTVLQWHVQNCLGSQSLLRKSVIDVVNKSHTRVITMVAAVLVDQMWNTDSNERLAGIIAVCKLYKRKSVPPTVQEPLKSLLRDDDSMVRCAAVHACSAFGIAEGIQAIMLMWREDPVAVVREKCEECLSKHDDPNVRATFAARKNLEQELGSL